MEEENKVNIKVYKQYRGWEKVTALLKQLKKEVEKENPEMVQELFDQLQDIKAKTKGLYGDSSEEYIVARKVFSDAKRILQRSKLVSIE